MQGTDKGRILWSALGAFLLAMALLVTLVLPAEYGWDPLGSGEALGLLGMSGEDAQPLQEQPAPWHRDRIIPPDLQITSNNQLIMWPWRGDRIIA